MKDAPNFERIRFTSSRKPKPLVPPSAMLRLPLAHPARVLATMLLLAFAHLTGAAVLTSNDGKKREFPVVISATREGLTVRETADGRDSLIPWARLDAARTAQANPWFEAARRKAVGGQVVDLNIGLARSASEGEWRAVQSTVTGGPGKNFTTLKLSARVHRDVPVPRLALVWVGADSPWEKRSDAIDLARRLQGALVVAEFDGAYNRADDGSGGALVDGIGELMKKARMGTGTPDKPSAPLRKKDGPRQMEEKVRAVSEIPEMSVTKSIGPALILVGQAEAASFVWSMVCTRPADVVAAITLNGKHQEKSTAGAFATPCLFLESPASATPSGSDLTHPANLWRHFSTDGCRWCHAVSTRDPLVLAVAFARAVAEASPYLEAIEMMESWEKDELRHRIPMPVMTSKNFKESPFRLARPNGASLWAVGAKTGAARNDLVWVPSATFAALLAGQ